MNPSINELYQRNNEIIIRMNVDYKIKLQIIEMLDYLNDYKDKFNIYSVNINDSTMEEVICNLNRFL